MPGTRQRAIIPFPIGSDIELDDGYGDPDSAARSLKPALFDCYFETSGPEITLRKRPGLTAFADTGESSAIKGLHWWDYYSIMMVVCNTKTWKSDTSGTLTQLTGNYFDGGDKCFWSEFGTNLYGADGSKIKKLTSTTVAEMADADAPITVGQIATLDQYLLAIRNVVADQKCYYSDVGDADSWTGVYFSAESKEDGIEAIGAENQRIILLGEKSCEMWYDSGASDPFARVEGGCTPSGTKLAFSFVWCGPPIDTWVWIDQNRNLVALNSAFKTSVLSESLRKTFQKDGQSFQGGDRVGNFVQFGGHSFYIFNDLLRGETWVYDFTTKQLQRWGDHATTTWSDYYLSWRGHILEYSTNWGKTVVGHKSDGLLYLLDEDAYQDDGDDIYCRFRTDFLDRGDSSATKICNSVTFRAKRAGTGTSATTLYFKYRNEGSSTWSSTRSVVLSQAADTSDFVGHVRRLGRYKTRQWEFWNYDNAPLELLQPIEDYEIIY